MASFGTELMQLSDLIDGFPIDGLPEEAIEVRGISHDSRQVREGDLFVGWIGDQFDGRVFSNDAVARGAVAVLGQGEAPSNFLGRWMSTSSPRSLLAPLAARLFDYPDRQLTTVGVTGTNGKSTVTTLLEAMLNHGGTPTGSMGTLCYRFGNLTFSGDRTTPEGSDLFRALEEMRSAGARAAVMEISSHALEQGRVAGLQLDLGIFLNLTRDHFDFHGGFDDYFEAKKKLFGHLKAGGRALVNMEDPYGRRLREEFPQSLGFGEGGEVYAKDVTLDEAGLSGVMVTPRERFEFSTSLLGRFNLSNVQAAVAAATVLGVSSDMIALALASQRPLPGRMESIVLAANGASVEAGAVGAGSVPVFVDYAHTDAALSAALRSLREFTRKRIVLVFGCGGDRDPGKRVLMGRAAGQFADLPIITSDNPRSEDPLLIISAIEEGIKQAGNRSYRVIPDRREAIRRAIAVAGDDGVVLVAGKGHEENQILNDRVIPFSDRDEVRKALEDGLGSTANG